MFVIWSLGDAKGDKISNNTLLSCQDTLVHKVYHVRIIGPHHWPSRNNPQKPRGGFLQRPRCQNNHVCIKPRPRSHGISGLKWIWRRGGDEGVLWPGVNIFILHSDKTFWGGHKNMDTVYSVHCPVIFIVSESLKYLRASDPRGVKVFKQGPEVRWSLPKTQQPHIKWTFEHWERTQTQILHIPFWLIC